MVNREKVRERLAKREEEKKRRLASSNWQFWSPTDKHYIRFLSDPETGDCFWESMKHRFINDDIRNIVCPKSMDEQLDMVNACPICDLADIYFKNDEVDLAKKLVAKTRFMFTILDMDQIEELDEDELEAAGNLIYVFERGPQLFDKFAPYIDDEEWGDITSPSEGVTFKLTKTGTGFDTTIDIIPSPKGQTALPQVLQDLVENNFPNLDRLVYPTVPARDLYYFLSDDERAVLAEHGKTAESYLDVSVYDLVVGNGNNEEPEEEEIVEESQDEDGAGSFMEDLQAVVDEVNEKIKQKTASKGNVDELKKKIKEKAKALKKKQKKGK